MYGIDGRTELPEHELTHLAGYAGSAPVRVGNAASQQLQLDIYGELIDAVYLYDKWCQPIPSDYWEALHAVVDWLCDHWDQPDEGIWETRGGRKRLRLLEADVLGGDRTSHPDGQPPRAASRRWSAGGRRGTGSTARSWTTAGPASGRRSCSTTAATFSTPRC